MSRSRQSIITEAGASSNDERLTPTAPQLGVSCQGIADALAHPLVAKNPQQY